MGYAVCLKCGVRTGATGYHAACKKRSVQDPLGPFESLAEDGTASELEVESPVPGEGASASRGDVADESRPRGRAEPPEAIGGGLDDAEGDPFAFLGDEEF